MVQLTEERRGEARRGGEGGGGKGWRGGGGEASRGGGGVSHSRTCLPMLI